jgi:hypothetical protein
MYYVCVYMYVYMHKILCMYYVCMYVFIVYVRMELRMCVFIHVNVCMYVCMHLSHKARSLYRDELRPP